MRHATAGGEGSDTYARQKKYMACKKLKRYFACRGLGAESTAALVVHRERTGQFASWDKPTPPAKFRRRLGIVPSPYPVLKHPLDQDAA